MAFVVLAGLFEPGTVVELFQVENERVLRVESQPLAGKRLVDAKGNIGFDGLEEGARFIARGTDPYGNPTEERCRALAEDEGTELAQAPIRPVPQKMGTQEGNEPAEPAGQPDTILQTGVPSGVPLGVADAA